MKNIGKLAVLGAVLAASASFAFADTITLGSYCSTCANPGGDNNGVTYYTGYSSAGTPFTIPNPNPAPNQTPVLTSPTGTSYGFTNAQVTPSWVAAPAGSTWIGAFSNANPGGPNVAQGFYTFQTTFSAVGGLYSGSLSTMSDDTVEVILDYGTSDALILNGFQAIGSDNHCADTPSPNSCSAELTDTLSNVALLAGNNTLTFIVQQAGNESAANEDPSGLEFSGSLSAPEPSSLMLLGTGLVGAAGMFYRRRQTV